MKKKSASGKRTKVSGWIHAVWTMDYEEYYLKRYPEGASVYVPGKVFETVQSVRTGETNRQFRERTKKEARHWGIRHVIGLDSELPVGQSSA